MHPDTAVCPGPAPPRASPVPPQQRLRTVNSETNLAVALLAALRGAPAAAPLPPAPATFSSSRRRALRSSARTSSDVSTDSGAAGDDDGGATDSSAEMRAAAELQRAQSQSHSQPQSPQSSRTQVHPSSHRHHRHHGTPSSAGTPLSPSPHPASPRSARPRSGAPPRPPSHSRIVAAHQPHHGGYERESGGRSQRGGVPAVPSLAAPASVGDNTLYKYTREERQEALRRFKEKKRLRTFKKTIRYDVRKRLADTRPRYKGRFSKPPAGENYDDGTPGPPLV